MLNPNLIITINTRIPRFINIRKFENDCEFGALGNGFAVAANSDI